MLLSISYRDLLMTVMTSTFALVLVPSLCVLLFPIRIYAVYHFLYTLIDFKLMILNNYLVDLNETYTHY